MNIQSHQSNELNSEVNDRLFGEALKRGPSSAVGNMVLISVLTLADESVLIRNSATAEITFALTFVLNIVRLFYCKHATAKPNLPQTKSGPYQRLYTALVLSSILSLATHILVVCQTYGFQDSRSLLALIILAGVASAGSTGLAGSLRTSQAFTAIALGYPAAMLLYIDLVKGYPISIVTILFMAYLLQNAKQTNGNLRELFNHRWAISRDRRYLRDVIDSLPAVVSVLNSKLKYVLVNTALLNLARATEDELLSKSLGDIAGESEYVQFVRRFFESSQLEASTQLQLATVDGPKWYLVNLSRLPTSDEIICVSVNINKEKQLELDNVAAQMNLTQSAKMASLGEMASGIAHEINNPLTVILGSVEFIAEQCADEKIDLNRVRGSLLYDTLKIQETSSRIKNIVKGMRSISRNSDDDPMVETPVSQIIKDTLEICTERMKKHGIKLTASVSTDASILCRASQLAQVLINLLNNAHDAVEGTPNAWIELTVTDVGDTLIIAVTDSGNGIPDHLASKILQPFFTTKEVGKGTGLGLSISSGIVSRHGGELKYVKDFPHTRFAISLPKSTGA